MTTNVFDRKGVYQSELVRVTDPDGLEITFTGKPRESKDGDSFYIYFRHGDEDHYLTIENDAIKEYLDKCPIDVPVTIHAFGSRDSATVAVDIDGGAAVIDGVAQTGPPLYPEDEQEAPQKAVGGATGNGDGDLYLRCLLAARAAHAAFTKQTGTPVSDEDIRIATTIYIAADKR